MHMLVCHIIQVFVNSVQYQRQVVEILIRSEPSQNKSQDYKLTYIYLLSKPRLSAIASLIHTTECLSSICSATIDQLW